MTNIQAKMPGGGSARALQHQTNLHTQFSKNLHDAHGAQDKSGCGLKPTQPTPAPRPRADHNIGSQHGRHKLHASPCHPEPTKQISVQNNVNINVNIGPSIQLIDSGLQSLGSCFQKMNRMGASRPRVQTQMVLQQVNMNFSKAAGQLGSACSGSPQYNVSSLQSLMANLQSLIAQMSQSLGQQGCAAGHGKPMGGMWGAGGLNLSTTLSSLLRSLQDVTSLLDGAKSGHGIPSTQSMGHLAGQLGTVYDVLQTAEMMGDPAFTARHMSKPAMPGVDHKHSNHSGHTPVQAHGNTQGRPGNHAHATSHAGHTSSVHGGHNTGDTHGKGPEGHHGHKSGAPGAGHDFVTHTRHLYPNALAHGQSQFGGYSFINDKHIVGRSTITGLKPVIEQAIDDIIGKGKTVEDGIKKFGSREALENKIANQLTNLNDWENLNQETQAELMILTGQNFAGMTAEEREKGINHLLHSPLPFGDVQHVLPKDAKVELGFTHTLDKAKTMAEDQGNGVWKITMISNNNNGSHTGHRLGSFMVDAGADATNASAIKLGNQIVTNTNNNDKLYLDQAARNILYGLEARNDFTNKQ